jgi:hypothetical protein
MQIDVELALINAPANELKDIQDDLPSVYFVEDRSNLGWGLVIQTTRKLTGDFNDSIYAFLEPLNPMINLARKYSGILRVGVFYNTVTCTMRLNSCERLAEFGMELEISTYPSSDAE